MKKWLRRILIAAILIGLTLAGLYEYATHVGRGWARDEAFFDGRPTSYWALRCDEWLERFEDNDSVANFTWLMSLEMPGQDGPCRLGVPDDLNKGGSMSQPRETFWKRMRDSLRSNAELERERFHDFAPKILWGELETVPVLEGLMQEEKYRFLASLAIRRVNYIHNLRERFKREAADSTR